MQVLARAAFLFALFFYHSQIYAPKTKRQRGLFRPRHWAMSPAKMLAADKLLGYYLSISVVLVFCERPLPRLPQPGLFYSKAKFLYPALAPINSSSEFFRRHLIIHFTNPRLVKIIACIAAARRAKPRKFSPAAHKIRFVFPILQGSHSAQFPDICPFH